jgi:hypothetical protein
MQLKGILSNKLPKKIQKVISMKKLKGPTCNPCFKYCEWLLWVWFDPNIGYLEKFEMVK